MLLAPFHNSIKISAFMYDIEIRPRSLSSTDPVVRVYPYIGIARNLLAQNLYAVIWSIISSLRCTHV